MAERTWKLAGTLSLDRRDRNFRPGSEDPIAASEQAVAMDLSRGDEERIVQAMTRLTVLHSRQQGTGAQRDLRIDLMDAIGEANGEFAEPLSQRGATLRLICG